MFQHLSLLLHQSVQVKRFLLSRNLKIHHVTFLRFCKYFRRFFFVIIHLTNLEPRHLFFPMLITWYCCCCHCCCYGFCKKCSSLTIFSFSAITWDYYNLEKYEVFVLLLLLLLLLFNFWFYQRVLWIQLGMSVNLSVHILEHFLVRIASLLFSDFLHDVKVQ